MKKMIRRHQSPRIKRRIAKRQALARLQTVATGTRKKRLLLSAIEKIDFVQNIGSSGAIKDAVAFAGHLKETQREVTQIHMNPEKRLAWFQNTIMVDNINQWLKNHMKDPLTNEEIKALFYQGIKK